jgi:putative FmdB family regulatory protein
MPIFEYKCHKCGTVYEEIVKTGPHGLEEDKQVEGCPICGGVTRDPVLSRPAILRVK